MIQTASVSPFIFSTKENLLDLAIQLYHAIIEVAQHFVHGAEIQEGVLSRVSAVVRAFDPCLSCSTHADGMIEMVVRVVGPDRTVRQVLWRRGGATDARGLADLWTAETHIHRLA